MSYLDWHAGMKVVCVKAPTPIQLRGETFPAAQRVYTIREIGIFEAGVFAGRPWIRLVEIVNTPRVYSDGELAEACWCVTLFRPVQTRKTDISIFTAMLHDVKRSEPVMLSTPWGRVPA